MACRFDEPDTLQLLDQLWINLAPIYFNQVVIIKEMGFNVAPWNLHERGKIHEKNGHYYMPDHSKLTFYHFSSYKYTNPSGMARYYNLARFSDFPEIKTLYDQYHEVLLSNKIEEFSKENCYFVDKREKYLKSIGNQKVGNDSRGGKLKRVLKACMPPVIWNAFKKTVN